MIKIRAKLWRPKAASRYTTPNFDHKDVDDILDYGQYGKCLYEPKLAWDDNSLLNDIIPFQDAIHAAKLAKDLTFYTSVDKETRIAITSIVTEFWDCFVKEGTTRFI